MNRTNPFQTLGKTPGGLRRVTIGHMKSAQILPPHSVLVVIKIECEQHRLSAAPKGGEALQRAPQKILVNASLAFRARSVKINAPLQALPRMEPALQAR